MNPFTHPAHPTHPVHPSQRGFSLPEMLVALVIASVMFVAISQAIEPALAFFGKQETTAKLADLRLALETAYKKDSKSVDAETGATFTLSTGTISPVAPNANRRCPSTATTFAAIGRHLATSAAVSALDGFNQGVCVFITQRLPWTVNGLTYYYHSIAIVSPGYDGALDPTTALSDEGALTLGGDDKGILLDGKKLVGILVENAWAQINRASDALSNYFITRYQSNSSRDIGIDYFAKTNRAGETSGSFDSTGSLPNSGGSAVAITTNDAHTVLGLSLSDVTDPWESVLLFDNSSDSVRNPENSTTSMSSPGYTARISTTLPSGGVLERTIIGTY